jgi:hypothetical protein
MKDLLAGFPVQANDVRDYQASLILQQGGRPLGPLP